MPPAAFRRRRGGGRRRLGRRIRFRQEFWRPPVIQSLTTLACTPNRRSDYFRGELIAALKILDHGDVKLEEFNGSWAGAFGNTQFMPSTFLRLAVDMDGDGRRDVIDSVPDALGSTANFLHHAGWVPGLPWGFEVTLPARLPRPLGTRRQAAAVVLGRTRPDPRRRRAAFGRGRLWPAAALRAAWPGLPGVAEFRRLLFLQRRRILCAWRSASWPTGLKGGPGIVKRPGRPTTPALPRVERREVQALLEQRGYDVGGKHRRRDGNEDPRSHRGLPASASA